nr:hypothetical protein [Tanacetum cinerariifolium]
MQIAPKRFKLEKEEEEDRISVLPECLLLEIISRLSTTKEAIRTSTLSKRWENLWTLVPNLVFRYDDDVVIDDEDYIYYDYIKDYVSFVDKALTQCRQLKLNKFKLDTKYDSKYKTQVQKRLDITSKSVKNLVFWGYRVPKNESDHYANVIKINAPNTLSLTIKGFYGRTQKEAVMLKRLILNLGHVKELEIDYFCFKVLAGLEAIGFVCPSNMVIPPVYYQMKRCPLI